MYAVENSAKMRSWLLRSAQRKFGALLESTNVTRVHAAQVETTRESWLSLG
jgi:hypothetical protein